MNTKKRERKGCFKAGCLGCTAVIVLAIGLPLLLAGIGFVAGAPERVDEREERSQELPRLPVPPPAEAFPEAVGESAENGLSGSASGAGLEAGTGTLAEGFDIGARELSPQLALAQVAPGTIELNLEMGEFIIEPGPASEGIRIEADYDSGSYRLEEHYEADEDGSWTYKIDFGSKVGLFRRMWGDARVDNEIRIILPRGRPFALKGEIAYGKSDLDLGGLWLTQLDMEARYGEHEIDFSEPLQQPIDELKFSGAFGETDIRSVGNASPASAQLSGRFGEIRMDLQGDWRQDSKLDVEFAFGACRVRLPKEVNVEIERASMVAGEKRIGRLELDEPPPEGSPTLTLSLDGSFGEMRVAR